jgi:hypothetical protein
MGLRAAPVLRQMGMTTLARGGDGRSWRRRRPKLEEERGGRGGAPRRSEATDRGGWGGGPRWPELEASDRCSPRPRWWQRPKAAAGMSGGRGCSG